MCSYGSMTVSRMIYDVCMCMCMCVWICMYVCIGSHVYDEVLAPGPGLPFPREDLFRKKKGGGHAKSNLNLNMNV